MSVHEAKMSSAAENSIPPISSNNHHAHHVVATKERSRRIQQLHDLEIELNRQRQVLEDELESRGANDLVSQVNNLSTDSRTTTPRLLLLEN